MKIDGVPFSTPDWAAIEPVEHAGETVDTAAQFYAQHPALVKTIGAGALAVLMSRISSSRK